MLSKMQLSDVWLLKEVPTEFRRAINLPDRDEGIDLIARTNRGETLGDPGQTLSHRAPGWSDLATFVGLAHTRRDISQISRLPTGFSGND